MRGLSIVALLWLVLLFIFPSCTSIGGVNFRNVETENIEEILDRGKEYQSYTTEDGYGMLLYAQPTYDGDEVQVTVGISNPTDENKTFRDNDIEIYRGNYQKNEWESLGHWSATNYYQNAYDEAKTEEVLATIAGVFSVLDAATGTTARTNVYTPYGNAYVTTRVYSPAMTGLTALAASSYIDAVEATNQATLQNLSDTLLYSSDIPAKSNYIGNLYIEADNVSPDYKLSVALPTGVSQDFIFSRSDRDSVINPWMDQTRIRHSIVFSHAIPQDRFALTYFWSKKNGIGFYTGLSFFNIFKSDNINKAPGYYYDYMYGWDNFNFHIDPDLTDKVTYYDGHAQFLNDEITVSMGFPVGMTYRVFSNSWLTAGAEIGVDFSTYKKAKLQYRTGYPEGEIKDYPGEYWIDTYETSMYFAPQIGLNFITNFLDFSLMLTYRIPDQLYFDVGIGLAF